MSAKRRRTARDARRRNLGQNFLTDSSEIERVVDAAQIEAGDLVVEIGAGRGALTVTLAAKGARIVAIERDPVWAGRLRGRVRSQCAPGTVEVVEGDFRDVPLPDERYRVVSSPPYGLTTTLLSHLLDRPEAGPWRADLLIQREVAHKQADSPPSTLRSAAWAPWWEFRLGPDLDRRAFRPVPAVDATVLIVARREQPVLPNRLAPRMRELLRPGWDPAGRS